MNKITNEVKPVRLKTLLKNIKSTLKFDHKGEIRKVQKEILELKDQNAQYQELLLLNKIQIFHLSNPSEEYRKELEFLHDQNSFPVFPYRRIRDSIDVDAGFDNGVRMPYVLHQTKKLFFPDTWTVEQARETYRQYVEVENLLGGGYSEKAPHQYESDCIKIKEGDIVLDIGSAEALFALNAVDVARKVYVFESESIWSRPLAATFAPYMDKVVIVNKMVSNRNNDNEITLASALQDEDTRRLFVKMDIEGFESQLIAANADLFGRNDDIRMACCTYHNHGDDTKIKNQLHDLGFDTEFSDGYMLFPHHNNLEPPYFRKGVIRGKKNAK